MSFQEFDQRKQWR